MKKYRQSNLADKLHKGSVIGLIGLTVVAIGVLGARSFHVLQNSRQRRKQQELALEKELLADGTEKLKQFQ